MIRAFTPSLRLLMARSLVVAMLAVLVGAACESSDPMESSGPIESPAAGPDSPAAAVDAPAPAFATVSSYSGLPYGPIGLWSSATTVEWGPAPFTGTQNYTDAGGVVTQISAARSKKQRLILAMTGGPSTRYTTNGKFDMTKWKNKLNTFNTSAIRNAIAAGVADGTIIGNQLIDEPETSRWGGTVSKAVIDQMATSAKKMFPSMPMGINVGPPTYSKWRTSEHFKVLDYVLYQYNHWVTSGNIAAWRDGALAAARRDGVTPAFSLNIMNGGVQDRNGWDCAGTGGKGTRYPNCRMTADQVKNWGRAIGTAGCAMQMWRYDGVFMSKSANQDAFRSVASLLASKPRRSCRRP